VNIKQLRGILLWSYWAYNSFSDFFNSHAMKSKICCVYDILKDLKLKNKQTEETTGADVTSFRFNLSDGTTYELIYVSNGVKNRC